MSRPIEPAAGKHSFSATRTSALAAARARDLFELTKPRLSSLVLVSAAVGMMLAPVGPPPLQVALWAMLGTAAAVGGANVLNCYFERDVDRGMRRTRGRPLPSGRLDPQAALVFGVALSAAGVGILLALQPVAAALAALAVISYAFVYTPLKRKSSLSTLVGAVPGAIPPMIGWVAATGSLDAGAWVLFAWLFLWQPPHFLALALVHREDYRAAGMPMLPVRHLESGMVERQMALYTAVLAPVPLLLVPLSRAGMLTTIAAPLLGLGFLLVVLRGLVGGSTARWARTAFSASILYLGVLLLVMVLDAGAAG